jgi:hypothetical protein
VDREDRESDRLRFPNQWNQFQQNKQQTPEGTPIDLLYPESPAIAATLRACGVFTIEQCAELSANAIENVGMGAQAWVNSAKKYIEAAHKGVGVTQMRAALEERDREIKVLHKTVETLKNRVEELSQRTQGVPDLAAIQALLAGAMQRPVHMPQAGFDSQAAMINATSATSQIEQAAKARRRSRTRIGG